MKVSLNTLKQYTSVDLPLDELVAKINAQLGGVEEIINLAERYDAARIVKVVSAVQHPDADRLRVCKIDDGGVTDVARDEDGYIQVVCGAPNAREGIYAVWLPPGSTVPSSYSEKELFVLGSRELRGVTSHGMLAAADELALGSDHEGIVEIDPEQWKPTDVKIAPGASFAKAYGLDDYIIDIENKMFTHRPDCFGQLGVAREVAGITGQQFTSPDWYRNVSEGTWQFADGDGSLQLEVFNEAAQTTPRFVAVAIAGVSVKPSPLWLQCELVRLGGKPINNIVDVTNYVMLLTGQPTHAYDYDKLHGARLGARMAKKGEKISLLNGKTYELDEADLVIADAEVPVGLAGVMGGGESEVSADTKNIVLEVANFDMYTIRKASMKYGLFTDAVTRFSKGQSHLQNAVVLRLLMQSIQDVTEGRQASSVLDIPVQDSSAGRPEVNTTAAFINSRLGLELSAADISKMLQNVECVVTVKDNELSVVPPFWRTDIELPEDIVEEVGRLYGFDKLPHELPSRSVQPIAKNQMVELKQLVRESLAKAGANEVLTYSFVHENVLKRAEQDQTQAFQLGNALSPELQYYRLSVLPSLLAQVHSNIKTGYDEFVLFELGKGHNKRYHLNDDAGLPRELNFIDGVYASKKARDGAPYFRCVRIIDQLADDLGFNLVYEAAPNTLDFPVSAPFVLERSALVYEAEGHTFVGMVGELKGSVRKSFKLPNYSAAFTLDAEGLLSAYQGRKNAYKPLPKFPKLTQDISLKVPNAVKFASVKLASEEVLVTKPLGEVLYSITPLGVYQSKEDEAHKTITLRISVASYERTLKDAEVTEVLSKIAAKAKESFGAELV